MAPFGKTRSSLASRNRLPSATSRRTFRQGGGCGNSALRFGNFDLSENGRRRNWADDATYTGPFSGPWKGVSGTCPHSTFGGWQRSCASPSLISSGNYHETLGAKTSKKRGRGPKCGEKRPRPGDYLRL